MTVEDALQKRKSVRGYLDKPVSRTLLEKILTTAQLAPSGGNLQPWRVIALSGKSLENLISVAQQRLSESPHPISYMFQNLRSFHLFTTRDPISLKGCSCA